MEKKIYANRIKSSQLMLIVEWKSPTHKPSGYLNNRFKLSSPASSWTKIQNKKLKIKFCKLAITLVLTKKNKVWKF